MEPLYRGYGTDWDFWWKAQVNTNPYGRHGVEGWRTEPTNAQRQVKRAKARQVRANTKRMRRLGKRQ